MSDDTQEVSLHPAAANLTLTGLQPTIEIWGAPPSGHAVYALLGQLSAGWAELDHILDRMIWQLAGVGGEIGASMTAQIFGYSPRCDAIIALLYVRKLPFELRKKVNSLREKLGGISKSRNRGIHDPWYVEASTRELSQFNAMPKNDLYFGLKKKELKDIELDILRIGERRSEAVALRDLIATELSVR